MPGKSSKAKCLISSSGGSFHRFLSYEIGDYFEAGACEVWIRNQSGSLRFFSAATTSEPAAASWLCPAFPAIIS